MNRRFVLPATLVLAFVLRLIALESRTLWYDEAFAVLFSEKGVNAMLYGTLAPAGDAAADVHPLLYYTLLHSWTRLFGQSPAAVRLLNVLLGVATIYVMYLMARDLFNERTGLAAAFITAIAPFHIQYSQEARMYTLLGLLLMLATWCFVCGSKSSGLKWWIGFGITAGLAMYAQQLAAFYLVALGLIPFVLRRREQIIGVIVGAVIALVIYFPWLINLPAQFGKLGQYWITRPGIDKSIETLLSFVSIDSAAITAPVLVASTLTFVLLATLFVYEAVRYRKPDSVSLRLVLWMLLVPIILMWLLSQWRPVYLTRALLPSGLMVYVALAWFSTQVRLPRLIRYITAGTWGITILVALLTHYTWATFPRPPFDDATKMLSDNIKDGDRVVHADKLTMVPMVYYDRTLPQFYVRDIPGSEEDTLAVATQEVLGLMANKCVIDATQGSKRVWFVIFSKQIEQEGGKSASLSWLQAHYRQQAEQKYNDLLVYLFDQPDEIARTTTCEEQSS